MSTGPVPRSPGDMPTLPRARGLAVRLNFLPLFIAIFLQSFVVLAQENPKDDLAAWVHQVKAQLLERIAKRDLREAEAQRALDQSLRALSLAERLKDGDATRISREAITIARTALARIRASELRDQSRLIALNRVSEFRSHSRALRLASPTGVGAPDESKGEIAVISVIKGPMQIKTSMGWAPYNGEFPIMEGDEVRTGENGFAEIMFPGGSIVNLDANSSFQAAKLDEKEFVYDKLLGRVRAYFHCAATDRQACAAQRFHSGGVIVSIRGTEFEMEARSDGRATIVVMDSVVEITSLEGGEAVKIHAGQKAVITKEGKVERLSTFDASEVNRWWE
jgi:hypothetical protein